MAKTRRTITAPIPTYERNRSQWRKKIRDSVLRARDKAGDIHDVDNRLKDILDALQGRFGSTKSASVKTRLIENDNQVSRVVIEKQPIPKMFGDDAGGRLLIRPYRPSRWPLQTTKGSRFVKRRAKST